MAHRETISEYEHRRERLNRLCKMNQFTDNFLRSLVSANSVVAGNIPAMSLARGNPAMVVKKF